MATVERAFKTASPMPNGLQGAPEGLYVVHQIHDNVLLVEEGGKVLQDIPTESSNSSGITVGGGYLWIGVNGATRFRARRPTDKEGYFVLKAQPETGKTLELIPIPDEGSVHGLEWRDGNLWVTNPSGRMVYEMDPRTKRVLRRLPLPLPRVHGLAWDEDGGLWMAFTADRVLLKFDVESGNVVERLELPQDAPSPHGLTRWKGALWYCDAETGWICRLTP